MIVGLRSFIKRNQEFEFEMNHGRGSHLYFGHLTYTQRERHVIVSPLCCQFYKAPLSPGQKHIYTHTHISLMSSYCVVSLSPEQVCF
jgi:hypothetical protein